MIGKVVLTVIVVLMFTACFPSNGFDLDESFDLAYGEIKRNSKANLRVRFDRIVQDDRCPFEAQPTCVAPGNALIELTLWNGLRKKSVQLNTDEAPHAMILFGYKIELMQLEPMPSLQTPPLDDADFTLTLMIRAAGNECFSNADCGLDDNDLPRYCYKTDGHCKSIGRCTDLVGICPITEDFVCGCNGQTYSNVCDANRRGVNVAYMGTCEPGKCSRNDECSADEYCFFAACQDETGQCQPRPQACTKVYEPVCGRIGREYANACEAASHGDSVAYMGKCLQRDKKCDTSEASICEVPMQDCSDHEILAYQNKQFVCVNPVSCKPWGSPGCQTDFDCGSVGICEPCATSSCPTCDDCVGVCITW